MESPPVDTRDSVRQAELTAFLGADRRNRAPQILFTTVWPGHRLDPEQAPEYVAWTTAGRLLRRRQDLRTRFAEIYYLRLQNPRTGTRGPVGRLFDATWRCGFEWTAPGQLRMPFCPDLDLFYASWGWVKHQLRQGLRCWQVSTLLKDGVSKRKDTVSYTHLTLPTNREV